MEILDEFDNECPLLISFCERISPQDFDNQAVSYTQKSLQDLFAQMEQNPGICERVVRKRKQAENEGASLAQYLKAKFFSMLQGDVNNSNSLGEMEMEEKVEQLKREMEKVNDYARAAKSASWRSSTMRPSEMRPRRTIPSGGFSPSQTKLLDSSVPPMPKVFGSFPKQMERSMGSNVDLKQLWAGMSSVNQKSMVDLRPVMLNPGGFRPSFLGSTSISRLKYTSFPRAAASNAATSSQSSPSPTSAFNTPVLAKFRGSKDEEKEDSENPGPDSQPTGA
ncbi:uncharacterized protein LOC128403346 [Podarcis raffonei]|uniref:uncharacterized protein LOC128403346 n=1 Tax=Podarcis raffonei TaxID=65483 RepID=UPI00232932BB|nr:uncharacterized protein LOC128403346 [Podarcis raffonei]